MNEKDLTKEELLQQLEAANAEVCQLRQKECEHQQVLSALRRSEQLLDRALHALRDAVFILEAATGKIVNCNIAATSIFGYTRNELLGNTATFLHVDENSIKEYRRHIYAAIDREGFMHQFEFKMKRKNGEVFPTEHDVLPLINAKGIRTGWVSVIRDITERKKAEAALYESEQKYRELVGLSPDAIFIIQEGLIKLANKAFSKLFLYTKEDLDKGVSFLELMQIHDREKALQIYNDRLQGKNIPTILQFDMLDKDGDVIPCEHSATPIKYEGIISDLVIVRDITERRLAQEELRNERDFAENLVNTAQAIILVLDPAGRIVRFNPWMEHLTGYLLEEVLGDDWFSVFLPNRDKEKVRERFLKTIEDVDMRDEICTILTKDGKELEIEWSGKVLKNSQGIVIGMLSIGQDVTEKRQAQRRSNLLSTAVEQSAEGIAVIDMEGKVIFSNYAFARLHGYDVADLIGKHVSIFHNQEQMEIVEQANKQLKEKGFFKGEVWHTRRDGKAFPTIMNNVILKDEEGLIIGLLGTMRDISAEREAREKLALSENNYRTIFEAAASLIISVDKDGVLVDCNNQVKKVLGYTKEELINKSIAAIIHPLDMEKARECLKKVMTEGQLNKQEYRMIRKDGKILNVNINPTGVKNSAGEFEKTICIIEDTTERMKYLKDLSRREAMLDAVRFASEEFLKNPNWHEEIELILGRLGEAADVSRVYIFRNTVKENGAVTTSHKHEWAAPGVISQKNNADVIDFDYVENGMGRWKEQLASGRIISGNVNDFPDTEKQVLVPEEIKSVLAAPIFVDGEWWGFMGMDEVRWQRHWTQGEEGALKAAADSLSAAIERQRRESAILIAKNEWEDTFDSISDCIAIVDSDNVVQRVNKTMADLFDTSPFELLGRKCYEIFHKTDAPPDFCPYERLKANEAKSFHCEEFFEKTLNKYFHVGVSSLKDTDHGSAVHVMRDVTERREMEEELIKAHKLDSLAILAGGIAHDFNNILAAIISNVSLAKTEILLKDDMYELLEEAEQAALRARGLTQQLLTFSKGGAPIKKVASIESLLKETTEFVLRGSNVKAEYFFSDSLWAVDIDSGQISQALQNLVLNSDQAMPQGGKLSVKAENIVVETENELDLPEGAYVKILIRDEGSGIPKNHISKIFDPYFTTKQKGSGLGLATTYAIIQKHGGLIGVASELGKGAEFTIFLPASQNKPDIENIDDIDFARGGQKILVMDDEEPIRKALTRLFHRYGYTVETVSEGQQALDLYKEALEKSTPFDLVILDITVPAGMGGEETIDKLLQLDPNVTAVVSSGYCNDPIMSEFRRYGFKGVLAKPYKTADLARLMKELFDPTRH